MAKRVTSLVLIVFATVLIFGAIRKVSFLGAWNDPDSIQRWVVQRGVAAPVAIVLLQAAQVMLAPIPGQAIGLAAGYLLGVGPATLLSIAGTTIGSLAAIVLARRLGRPALEGLIPDQWLSRLDAGSRKRGLLFLLVVYLVPFIPDDMLCLAAGLTPIPLPFLVLVAVVGRTPGLWVSCWLGAHAAGFGRQEWALLLTVCALLGLVLLFWRERIGAWSAGLAGRWR